MRRQADPQHGGDIGRASSRLAALGRRWLVALALFPVFLAPLACQRAPESEWLDRVEAAHQLADQAKSEEEREAALVALREAVDAEAPSATSESARRGVRQDLYYRLAELELNRERPAAALESARAGIRLGVEEDVFSVNLLISKGKAHEALKQKAEASKAYYDALRISDALLARSLGMEADEGDGR